MVCGYSKRLLFYILCQECFFSFFMYNIDIERIVKEELIMKVIVRGKNVTITDAIEDKITKS